MAAKEENNPHVSRAFCNERFLRVSDMLSTIDKKVDEIRKDRKAWKSWSLGIASSIITGMVLYGLTQLS